MARTPATPTTWHSNHIGHEYGSFLKKMFHLTKCHVWSNIHVVLQHPCCSVNDQWRFQIRRAYGPERVRSCLTENTARADWFEFCTSTCLLKPDHDEDATDTCTTYMPSGSLQQNWSGHSWYAGHCPAHNYYTLVTSHCLHYSQYVTLPFTTPLAVTRHSGRLLHVIGITLHCMNAITFHCIACRHSRWPETWPEHRPDRQPGRTITLATNTEIPREAVK